MNHDPRRALRISLVQTDDGGGEESWRLGQLHGYTDTDQLGNPRFVFGANSIDHAITDVGKVKVAYDITPAIRASYVLGVWGLNSDVGVQSFLKDASGNTLWPTTSTITTLSGTKYKLAAINPSKAEATHLMQGASLKSDTRDIFDFDASVSSYNFQRDRSRAPTTYNGTDTVAGKDTQQDGSGWWTAETLRYAARCLFGKTALLQRLG